MPLEHPAEIAAHEAVKAAKERVIAAEYGTPAYCRARAERIRAEEHEGAMRYAGYAAAWDALAKRPAGMQLDSNAAQAVWDAGYLAGIDAYVSREEPADDNA